MGFAVKAWSMKCTRLLSIAPPPKRPVARRINDLSYIMSRVPRNVQWTPCASRTATVSQLPQLPPPPALSQPNPSLAFCRREFEVEALCILEHCTWLHASAATSQLPEAVDQVVTKALAPRVRRLCDLFHHWPASLQDGDLAHAINLRTILDAAVVNFVMGVRIWGLQKLSEPLDGIREAVAEWDDASYLWESVHSQPSSQLFGFPLGYQRKLLLSIAVSMLGCGCAGHSRLPSRWDDRLRILALAHVLTLLWDVKEEGGNWEELTSHVLHKLRLLDGGSSVPLFVIAQLRTLLPYAALQQLSDHRLHSSSPAVYFQSPRGSLVCNLSRSDQPGEFSKVDLKLLLSRSKVVFQTVGDGRLAQSVGSVHPLSLLQVFRYPLSEGGTFTRFDESLLVRDVMLFLSAAGSREVTAVLAYCLKGAVALGRRRGVNDDTWRRNLQMLARLGMSRIGVLATMPSSHPSATSQKLEKEEKERRDRSAILAHAQEVVDSLMLIWDWSDDDLPLTFRAAANGCCRKK